MTNRKQKRAPAPKLKQPVKHRPTAAEKDERVSQVMTALLSGSRRIEIVQFAAKTWGVEDRQADAYIAEATALIKAEASKTREELVTEHLGRMNQVYRSAHGAGDFSNAIKAQQEKAKIAGIYPDAKVKVETWQDEVIRLLREGQVSPDDVIAEFGESGKQLVIAAGAETSAPGEAEGKGASS